MAQPGENRPAPREGAAVPHQPTVDEVRMQQAEHYPQQASTAMRHRPATSEELAAVEAGGEPVDDPDELLIEGPNSA